MNAIELGGGNCPTIRPNFDCRRMPTVDVVVDFESGLPIASESLDFVYSQFAIEHISWRKVPIFVAEIFRVLVHRGKAVVITADLRAQCLFILKKPVWTFAEMETIFGSQDYGENAHKSSMSPELAAKVFRDAGFISVEVSQVGICCTDMLIQAVKA